MSTRRRQTAKDLTVRSNLRCTKIYPREGSKKTLAELKTVAFELTSDEALELGMSLIVASRKWQEIALTGFRQPRKSDGTYQVSVTSRRPRSDDE